VLSLRGENLSLLPKILMLGVCFFAFWPCWAESAKVIEIGLAPQRVFVEEVNYQIEPASLPFDLKKFIDSTSWQKARDGKSFGSTIRNNRIILNFDFSTENDVLYFNYGWAAPLKSQKFVLVDTQGHIIETQLVRKELPLVKALLPKGRYKAIFVAEPGSFSNIKIRFNFMNSAHFSDFYLKTSKLHFFVYGVGLAFIFFNFTMFLLHRKLYFIYYVGYSLTLLYPMVVGTGDIQLYHAFLWHGCLVLNCLFTVLLSWTVLRLHDSHPILLKAAFILWWLAFIFSVTTALTDIILLSFLAPISGLLCYLVCIFAAIRKMQSGYIPATFFALGWAVLAIGYGLNYLVINIISIPYLFYSAYIAYAFESMLFAVALAYRTRDSEQRAVQDKVHALSQLKKVVYPHQMEQIKAGQELESTMPTSSGHACVISFDIIGSSKIKHIRAKTFFRNVFTRCNALMSEGYDGANLKANAYRIKEMGDGFLCSVGYPFQSMTDNPANEAVDLARRFAEVLTEEAEILHADTPIACGIGIALDTMTGFYPEAGTKEYDLYGPALILATRYEGMRKTLFEAEKGRNILIIQEVVYQSLDPSHRSGFQAIDLKEVGVVVRDDPAATRLYYLFLDKAAKAAA
jgi:class 3 adenylate cyclase